MSNLHNKIPGLLDFIAGLKILNKL